MPARDIGAHFMLLLFLLLLNQFHLCIQQNKRYGIDQCKAKVKVAAAGHVQAHTVQESRPTAKRPKDKYYPHPDKMTPQKERKPSQRTRKLFIWSHDDRKPMLETTLWMLGLSLHLFLDVQ